MLGALLATAALLPSAAAAEDALYYSYPNEREEGLYFYGEPDAASRIQITLTDGGESRIRSDQGISDHTDGFCAPEPSGALVCPRFYYYLTLFGGNDRVEARDAAVAMDLYLGSGDDRARLARPRPGEYSFGDSLSGGDGDDRINGGSGSDFIYGGSGSDVLRGGTDDDWVNGGHGGDRLAMDDGIKDNRIDCGDANDRAVVDRRELRMALTRCERVRVR